MGTLQWRKSNTLVALILLVLRSSITTDSNKSELTLSTKNCNNFSTSTCSPLNKKNTSKKVLNGQMLTSVWTCKYASPWLEKNKDPLNDTVVELMKNGSNALLVECFLDHPGQPLEAKKDAGGGGKKKGGGKTVTSFFKSQLDDLMKVLYSTDPSFIRCVVPNTHKQPGGVQPELTMHQYQCN